MLALKLLAATTSVVEASSSSMASILLQLVSLGHLARSSVMKSPSWDLSPKLTCSVSRHILHPYFYIYLQLMPAAAIDYLDSGKVKVEGIVNKVFKLEQWAECLESMRNKSAIKAAITFD